jgi:hypothetical protein
MRRRLRLWMCFVTRIGKCAYWRFSKSDQFDIVCCHAVLCHTRFMSVQFLRLYRGAATAFVGAANTSSEWQWLRILYKLQE